MIRVQHKGFVEKAQDILQTTANSIHPNLEVVETTSNTVDDCITTGQSAFLLLVETLNSAPDRV